MQLKIFVKNFTDLQEKPKAFKRVREEEEENDEDDGKRKNIARMRGVRVRMRR